MLKINAYFMVLCLGSSEAILALVNAGASVDAEDKDGLTGNKASAVITFRFRSHAHVIPGLMPH